jgi:hypothetical protein
MDKKHVKEFIEDEAFDIIQQIASEQSNKKFAYYDKGDLEQEIWRICIEAMPFYEPKRGKLDHWLRRVVANRLKNIYNSVSKTIRTPCSRCDYGEPHKDDYECLIHEDKFHCKKYCNFRRKIGAQQAMVACASLDVMPPVMDEGHYVEAEQTEMYESIISYLPSEYVEDFMLMVSGYSVSSDSKSMVREEVRKFLSEEFHAE